MEGPVRITVTSRSLFDGGAETLHFSGAGTLRPTAAGWDLDPEHETQARLPLGLTVAVRTRAVEFSLEEPDRGYIHLAYTLLDRGLPLSRMQLEIRMTKETI